MIEKACAVAAADDRIVAAWLGGSFAAGTADAFSDIDLNCAITDESADWFAGHWTDVARQITPLVLAAPIPGVLGGIVITPEWLHLDLVFHRRSQCDPAALTTVEPLFDRTGTLLPAEHAPAAGGPGEPYFPARAVSMYFYLLGNLAGVLGRGEVLLAVNGAIMRRDLLGAFTTPLAWLVLALWLLVIDLIFGITLYLVHGTTGFGQPLFYYSLWSGRFCLVLIAP